MSWMIEGLESRVHLAAFLSMNALGGATAESVIPGTGRDIHVFDPDTVYVPVLSPNRDVEMSIAVNPANPLQLAGITITTGYNFQEVDVYHSEDGGGIWSMTPIRTAVDGYSSPGMQRTDPSLVYDANGELYISYIIIISGISNMLVAGRSSDNGATFHTGGDGKFPMVADGSGGLNVDKSLLTTGLDPTTGSQAAYVAWTQNGQVKVSGSRDGGATWTTPLSASGTFSGLYACPAVGPNGELYISYSNFVGSPYYAVYLVRDLDGLWGSAYNFTGQLDAFWVSQVEPAPVLAVDRSGGAYNGSLYVILRNGAEGASSVAMTYSRAQGAPGSWTVPPPRVDSLSVADEELPWVAVDQRSGGANAIYYTVQADGLHARVATSTDGGATFASAEIPALVAGENPRRLEYIGIAAQDGTAHALWSTAPSPANPDRPYDLYYSRISFASTNADNVLTVTGTAAGDTILLRPSAVNADYLEVLVNGVLQYAGIFATLNKITVDGGAGNDSITIAAGVNVPVTVTASGGDDALTTSGSQVTLNVSSGSVTLNGSAIFAAVTIAGGARLNLAADGSRFIRTNALTIADTGTLDLFDNDLIVQSDAANRDTVLGSVSGWIGSARGSGGSWLGYGITSTAARNQPSHITGLAPVINQKLNGGVPAGTITDTFDGQAVDQNCILVKYTYNGDANVDGLVNFDDYFLINTGFLGQSGQSPLSGYRWGDFNFDTIINFDDYYLINTAFLGQGNTILGPSLGDDELDLPSDVLIVPPVLSTLDSFQPGLTIDLTDASTGLKEEPVPYVGQTVVLAVWATVTGSNPDAYPGLQSLVGSFVATQVNGGAVNGRISRYTIDSTFKSNGWSYGTQQDLNGDGNLDLGSNDPDSATGWWIANGSSMDWSPDPGTYTWFLGMIKFTITQALEPGGSTQINFVRRGDRDNGAMWNMDYSVQNGSSADIHIGDPVVFTR